MCGITGIFSYSDISNQVDSEELLRIREAMISRGPDGAGLWLSENKRIGLAHRRLSIIDLSESGAQPMSTHDGCYHVVFNGEIYNYQELRVQLEAKGYFFRSNSDTEVLLHLYAEYNADMVEHLRGMYAFAIWDDKKQGLFLARDPFGIKPLYYSNDGKSFRFASQVKALLKGGRIDTTPQPAGHVGFYLWGYVPEPYTLYKGVSALPAGSTLWIDLAGHNNCNQFFNLSKEVAQAEELARSMPSSSYTPEFLREAIKDSVQSHQIADVDVGLFLSAGLDSTTLTALAAESNNNNLNTISLGFEEYKNTDNDETVLAAVAAKHYGTHHQTRFLSKQDFMESMDDLMNAMDQPSTDGINTYFVSKIAKESGMKVALSGVGGDELFGGYPSFKHIPEMVKLFGWSRNVPSVGKTFRWLSAPILRHMTSPKYAGLLEYGGSYGGAYLLRRGLYMPWELPSVLDADMVREGWNDLQPLIHLEESIAGIGKDKLKVSALELSFYMRSQLLRDVDWAGMAHSLEIRVPLVDINLFRTLLPSLVSRKPPTKQDMALVPNKKLPEKIFKRPKTGFSVPVREWLLSGDATLVKERGLRPWAKYIYGQNLDL
jgi:asparagine synthase (glutamine-hydrolysing)